MDCLNNLLLLPENSTSLFFWKIGEMRKDWVLLSMPSKNRPSIYPKGDLNSLIDGLLHPLFDLNPAFRLVDAILHGFVERNPPETALKFLRYNLPRIIGELNGKRG